MIAPGNITFIPLDALGNVIDRPSLDWSRIAVSTLYTTKNAFDNGCGAANTCSIMPACLNIPGCDGFSVPSAILQQLLPANGYRINLAFRVNPLLAASQSRQLLQVANGGETDQISFTVRIVANQTITTVVVPETTSAEEAFLKSDLALILIGVLGYIGISQWSFVKNRRSNSVYSIS